MITNPHLLVKVRSELLKAACRGMPCTLRLGTFLNMPCHHGDSEAVHLDGMAPALGKGQGTKVSDLNMVAGCRLCHSLLDRSHHGWQVLVDKYPAAVLRQIHLAHMETIARWVSAEVLIVPDMKVI